MKLTKLGSLATLFLTASTLPTSTGSDFSLSGFAKDNPIGPTTGGSEGETITVTTPSALTAAVKGDNPLTIHITGTFNLTSRLRVGSNKSLIGTGAGANILHSGITIINASNVIVRNLGIRYILDNDGITIQNSTRVWIDHNEFQSDIDHGPDYYDGQCDVVRASDWVTISWNYFHDHWKSSLVGNSDALRDVDQGHLHITYQYVCPRTTTSPMSPASFSQPYRLIMC
jgi:pectate lyase